MKTSHAALALGGAAAIGLSLFLLSRKAAAKEQALEAFSVNVDCTVIKVLNEDAAKTAAVSAALAVGIDPSGNAVEKLREIAKVLLPTCPWGSKAEDLIAFEVPGRGRYTWSQIKDYVGSETTVAGFRKLIGQAAVEPTAAAFLLEAL